MIEMNPSMLLASCRVLTIEMNPSMLLASCRAASSSPHLTPQSESEATPTCGHLRQVPTVPPSQSASMLGTGAFGSCSGVASWSVAGCPPQSLSPARKWKVFFLLSNRCSVRLELSFCSVPSAVLWFSYCGASSNA